MRWDGRDGARPLRAMRRLSAPAVVAALLFAASACSGGGGTPTNTLAPGATSTPRPATSPAPLTVPPGPAASQTAGSSANSRLSAAGGAIGETATATMRTAPGASCTITYTAPSGDVSTDPALAPKTSGGDGEVSWSWSIVGRPGQGRVAVSCGADQATMTITVSP